MKGDKVFDQSTFIKTANTLKSAIDIGFSVGYQEDTYTETRKALVDNVYVFSAFKTNDLLLKANALLRDDKGNIRDFSQFKADIDQLNTAYNKVYLRTEYDYAIASAQMAGRWGIIKDQESIFPNLEYHTVGDSRVRAEHAALNGIIKPVNDAFWQTYYPPNGWKCRCDVLQREGSFKPSKVAKSDLPELPAMFRQNSGMSGAAFPDTHPYYETATAEQAKKLKEYALKYTPQADYISLAEYRNGGSLKMHPLHNAQEIDENTKTGLFLAQNRYEVKLLDYAEGRKNPDALVNGKVADFKEPDKKAKSPQSGIEDAIRKANKQKASLVVITLSNPDLKHADVYKALRGVIKPDWNKGIEEVWFIKDKKLYKVDRQDILDNKFSKRLPK